jgi:secreted trypsin-like serine protease
MLGVTREDCSSAWDRGIGASQMCVRHSGSEKVKKGKTSTSICDGDSGGPLVDEAGEVLVGLVSYGVATCDTDMYPNVFSFVFAAREWILENLK